MFGIDDIALAGGLAGGGAIGSGIMGMFGAKSQIKAMQDAGITVCSTPAEIGEKVKSRL